MLHIVHVCVVHCVDTYLPPKKCCPKATPLTNNASLCRDNYVQWLRFLWESYRTCLEVLKNNVKLEELYADTAKKTFKFCVHYKRKVEFRRLKDLLKTHLHMAPQSYSQPISENTLRLRVEVRAEQLNAATKLDLWQLAFESAEELHTVISHPANRKVLIFFSA
jgi:hypothetical protein